MQFYTSLKKTKLAPIATSPPPLAVVEIYPVDLTFYALSCMTWY